MVSSRALTVAQYLAELPRDRRDVISAIRDVINRNLPPGYIETMNWGMICWEIPLSRVPETYNGHPLSYLALAAQKNNFAFYSIGAYGGPELTDWLRAEFRRAGQRLDMGKSCIRFRKPEGLPMSVIVRLASYMTVEQLLEHYAQGRHGSTKPTTRPAPRKTARVAPAARAAKKKAPAKRKPTGRASKPAARKSTAKTKRR